MRIPDDRISFQQIVPPSQSGLGYDIVRFVRGDGSVTIMGVPFGNAASARIDVAIDDFRAGRYPEDLPIEAVTDARLAMTLKNRRLG